MSREIMNLVYRLDKLDDDIARLQRHLQDVVDAAKDFSRSNAIEWARLAVTHPYAVLLIIETTHIVRKQPVYQVLAEIEPIRFTTLNLSNGELFDQKVRPTLSEEITETGLHGLTMDNLEDKHLLGYYWSEIESHLLNRQVIIFGKEHAESALDHAMLQHDIIKDAFDFHSICQGYYTQFYDLSLERVLAYQGIDKKRHELKDSVERIRYLEKVLRNISIRLERHSIQYEGYSDDPFVTDEESSLDEHPF